MIFEYKELIFLISNMPQSGKNSQSSNKKNGSSAQAKKEQEVFMRVILVAIFIFALAGCGYTGPGLTSVISTSCANEYNFNNFRTCVNNIWFRNIVAQGYGSDPLAQQFNSRVQLLAQGVAEGQFSDTEAIINATNFAYQLRSIEQADMAAQNEALRQLLQGAASYTSPELPANTSPTSFSARCTRVGDISRQVFTFSGIVCPIGYAPSI